MFFIFRFDVLHNLNLEYSQMTKNKVRKYSLSIIFIYLTIGLIFSPFIYSTTVPEGHSFQYFYQESDFKILVIDCQSTIFSELCSLVDNFFTQEEESHLIIKRKYDNIEDIVTSKLKGFDLLIVSGSSTFFPDSPEVKEVATLFKISIDQNKHAFGICFGLQLLDYLLDLYEGKLIKSGSWDEDVSVNILKEDSIFKNVGNKGDSFITRQYHKYSVPFHEKGNLSEGTILAKSKDGIEIIRTGNVVATQFHPESRYASPEAKRVFENYLKKFHKALKNQMRKILVPSVLSNEARIP